MGISRDSLHKRRKTGGKKAIYKKKRKDTMGRPVTLTKLGSKRIHIVRTRGGNEKKRALRLETGNFSWGSESVTRKARILDVVYNATNNEFVRTKTLVKNSIVQIDATPFKNWYQTHYRLALSKKKNETEGEAGSAAAVVTPEGVDDTKLSTQALEKIQERRKTAKVESALIDQFAYGKLYACISSRPGQCGRCDGFVIEGKELDFYKKKIRAKKTK